MSLRSSLYKLARFLGDLNAISRGPRAIVKRVGRKAVWRITGRIINKLFR